MSGSIYRLRGKPAAHLTRVRDARRGKEHRQYQESDCLPKLAHRDTVVCLLHAPLAIQEGVRWGTAARTAPSHEPPRQGAEVSKTARAGCRLRRFLLS